MTDILSGEVQLLCSSRESVISNFSRRAVSSILTASLGLHGCPLGARPTEVSVRHWRLEDCVSHRFWRSRCGDGLIHRHIMKPA